MSPRWRRHRDLAALAEHCLMESRQDDFLQDEVTGEEAFVLGKAYCPLRGAAWGPAGRGCRCRWGEEPRGVCRWLVHADPPEELFSLLMCREC